MSSAIGRILGFLRTVKIDTGWGAWTHTQQLIGEGATPAQVTKLCAWVLEAADAADLEVKSLDIDQEMKDGILFITGKVREGFSPPNVNNGLQNYFPVMAQTILTLSTFLKLMGRDRPYRSELAADMLSEIEGVLSGEAMQALDPQIAAVARQHLRLLSITLNHLDAFGVDAALIAYAELMVRLQQTMRNAAPTEQKKASGIFETFTGWAKKLKTLNEAYETGSKLLENASEAIDLIGMG